MGSGMAAVMGALVGVAAVLPIAIVLGILPLRSVIGWPLWLLRVLTGR